jgi:hypothetical protein
MGLRDGRWFGGARPVPKLVEYALAMGGICIQVIRIIERFEWEQRAVARGCKDRWSWRPNFAYCIMTCRHSLRCMPHWLSSCPLLPCLVPRRRYAAVAGHRCPKLPCHQ